MIIVIMFEIKEAVGRLMDKGKWQKILCKFTFEDERCTAFKHITLL